MRQDIIGGLFGLELGSSTFAPSMLGVPLFLGQSHLLLATARSAFPLLVRNLRPETVWLPSYLCGVLMHAFPIDGLRVRFYGIDQQLRIADDAWLKEIQTGDMVVFIDYFGFNLWSSWAEDVRRRGAWVVEDACHAMLNDSFCCHAHYVICSPRKFVGVPDGGILWAQGDAKLPEEDLVPPPALWWLGTATASQLRAEFDRHGGEKQWFDLFQRAEADAPIGPFWMSDLSEMLLRHAVDWQEVGRKRRYNFSFLASELPEIALFDKLPNNVVPLGFPVRLKNRDMVREALFARQIYPPVHWAIHDVVPSHFLASHRLAGEIMTLPCDQRYGEDDMLRLVAEVKREVLR